MHVQIQVIITEDDGTERVLIEVATLQRTELTPETVGLTLADGKLILTGIQEVMTQAQAVSYTNMHQVCPVCQQPRA
jgi:hypothetical protein